MARWDRLAISVFTSGGFLEKSDGCKGHPASLVCLFTPLGIAPVVGSASLSHPDAEIGSVLRDPVGSETQLHLPLACVIHKAELSSVKLCGFKAAEELAQ